MKLHPIKIVKNKLDIWLILLVVSTVVPILFNTYVSLYGSVKSVLNIIYALFVYVVLRTISKNHKKIVNIIINLLIIFAVFVVIIGIDGLTTNALKEVLAKVNIVVKENGESRMTSIFAYSNVLAAFLTSILFLNFNQCFNSKDIHKKNLYKVSTTILLIGIILSYSKAMFILLPILVCTYCFFIKEKSKKIEILTNTLTSLIITFFYVTIFEKIADTNNIVCWIVLFMLLIINYLANILIFKLKKIKKNVNKKVIITSICLILLILFLYLLIALNQIDEYSVFTNQTENNYDAKIINHINGNTEYIFEFDIVAISPKNIENTYRINLLERDSKNREIKNTEIKFGTYTGQKNIKIKTAEETTEIKVEFESEYKYAEKELTIKSLYINQKQVPLKYKYLPTKLIEKIKDTRINYKTSTERIAMIRDALELSTKNIFTGIGGEGWKYKYKEVQDYNYTAKKLHSYPAKVLLEDGLIGIIAYLGIVINIIKITIKVIDKQDIEQISIIFAICTVGIHSLIDMDMEFFIILLYMVGLLGIVSNNLETKEKKTSIVSNVIFGILLIVTVYLSVDSDIYNKYAKIDNLIRSQNGLNIKSSEYLEIERKIIEEYKKITKYEKYDYLYTYNKIINYYISLNNEETLNILEEYYEKIKGYKNKEKYNIDNIDIKLQSIYEIIKNLENTNNAKYYGITERFIDLFLQEYPETIEQLKDCLKEEHKENENTKVYELEESYKKVKELKDRYLLGVRIFNDSEIEIPQEINVKLNLNKNVLIYHTHASESYKSQEYYEVFEHYRTLNENYNVIRIGNYLEKLLIEKQFSVTHSVQYYDLPTTTGAYERAKSDIEGVLFENKNINQIFDIHRDSYTETDHVASTVKINGKQVANLRFVIGINKEDEKWMHDLKLALEIQKQADEKYPGLFKPILIRERNYNQDLSENAILLEVGENCNYIEEAENSIECFAELLEIVYNNNQ